MPSKHQPDFSYLRHVPLRKVHLFTLVQIMCLAVLWTLKSTFLAIIFPVMVRKRQIETAPQGKERRAPNVKPCRLSQILGLMVVRKMLDMIFSQHDLAWLDDLLPEKEKKKKDDDKKKKKSKGKEKEKEKRRSKADDSEEEVRNALVLPPAGGQQPCHQRLTTCVCLQDKGHIYSNHSPSSESDLDRRYCVLRLHIPYKDLLHADAAQPEWGASRQAASPHTHASPE